jgi:hypothetical protein
MNSIDKNSSDLINKDWYKSLAVRLINIIYGPLNKKYCFYFKILTIFWFTCIILAIISVLWKKTKDSVETYISLFMLILYFGIYFLQNYILYDMCKNTLNEDFNTRDKNQCKKMQQKIFNLKFKIKQKNEEISRLTRQIIHKYNLGNHK